MDASPLPSTPTPATGPATSPATSPATGPTDTFAPVTLGPVRLRNRVIKAATYEGLSHRGLVTRDLVDFHVGYARGGVGMTTVAYCAVAKDGRTDKHQLHWSEESLPGMRVLTDAVHAEGAAVSAQIGHGGPVAIPSRAGAPLAPSRTLNKTSGRFARAIGAERIRQVVEEHAEATRRAVATGFDAVEVHLGHNYLISSFLSPRLNRRDDEHGGPLENRARLARDVMRAVRDAAGDRIAVVVKMNMDDGVRGGFWLDEAIPVAQWLEADGTCDALELTAGSSLLNPMYLFKGDAPVEEFAQVMPPAIRLGVRTVGKRLLRAYPYRDAYLLEDARQVRAAVDLPMVLLGGITDRAGIDLALREGFEYVAMGRALLREPDLVARLEADAAAASLCIHCNKCMPTNFTGTRCVLVDRLSTRSADWGQPSSLVGDRTESTGTEPTGTEQTGLSAPAAAQPVP